MPKRIKTNYPGVFYREAERIGGRGKEKVFYVVYKKNGKLCEEKAGRQYADDMTPARASYLRSELIEGKKVSRKEQKRQEEEQKKAEAGRYTIDRLWKEYKTSRASGAYSGEVGHPFRTKSTTCSGRSRPPIPDDLDHPFRAKSAICSD